MNGLLFLLPFILVASVGLYQDSFAVSETRYKDYSVVDNLDGTFTNVFGLPQYILDVDGTWKPYIIKQNANSIYVINEQFPIRFDKSTGLIDVYEKPNGSLDGVIYDSNFVKPNVFYTDKWSIAYKVGSNPWVPVMNPESFPTTYDTQQIENGYELTVHRTHNKGTIDTTYQLVDGKYSKPTSSFTNDPVTGFTNTKVAPINILSNINLSDAFVENSSVHTALQNMDVNQTTTWTKAQLQSKLFALKTIQGNTMFADLTLGYDDLLAVQITKLANGNFDLIIAFNAVSNIGLGETVSIDPTFGYDNTGNGAFVYGTAATGTSCDVAPYNVSYPATFAQIDRAASGVSGSCSVGAQRWDISSLPTAITVTNTNVRYDVSSTVGGGKTGEWRAMIEDPSTATAAALWADIQNGTTYYTADANFQTVANDYVIDLGTSADTDISNARASSQGWWSVGFHFTSMTRDGTRYATVFPSDASTELEITYTPTNLPDKITDLGLFIAQTATTIGLNWTAPSPGTGGQTIIGYQINVTTPQTGDPLVFLNDTGTTTTNYNVTGLTWGTDYSARVSAWTNNTAGHPFNNATGNIYNFTTTYTEYATPPTLTKVFPDGYTSTSQLNLEWSAGSMDNINGYRIAREVPVGGGFSNIVSNTTTTTAYYNNTGLSTNTYYNYKIYAMNNTGISTASNTYVMTTYHLPDAVTDLIAEATDLITIILTWTQPTLYGTLDGYQINYTTPYGDPQTIITNSTESSDIEYEITGLSGGNQYSFRVAPVTFHGTNTTGNIANATAFQNFEIGSIEFPTGDNPNELFEITFENYEHNSTATDVQVVYDSSMDLICDFSFVNGNTNQTYSGLTENAISGSSVYSNFTLQNPNNEIIDIYCYDSLDNATDARHRLTNTVYSDIPIINQILGFQSGDYGTTGMFGAIDLITLLIVIISIIGFNRVNPAVGVIFMFMMLGIMAWFELIVVPTAILGIIILIITLAIASVKKA